VAQVKLPFGGVGNSGYGRYHGRASIESFSWQKTYYSKSQKNDIRLMYPPYQDKHLSLMRRFRKWLP
jgi:aldehyde dehydrogenase (NAD+)